MKCARIFATSVLLVVLDVGVNGNVWRRPITFDNETDIVAEWKLFDKGLTTTVRSLIKTALPSVLEMNNEVKLTSQCTKDSLQLVTGFRQLKLWAFSFVDSSAKVPSGILSGSSADYGDYDQCLDTVVPNPKSKDRVLFRGQYCVAEVRFPLPPKTRTYKLKDNLDELRNFTGTDVVKRFAGMAHLTYFFPIRMGICVPSGCSLDDIQQIAKYVGNRTHSLIEVPNCEVKEENIEFSLVQYCAILCCTLLGLIVLVGTWLDIHKKKCDSNQSKVMRLLFCFSAATNFRKLLRTKTSDQNFRCLHGVRFLTIMWVVHGHAYLYPAWFLQHYRAAFRAEIVTQDVIGQMVVNSSEAVDTFFFMSGMLLSYFTITRVVVEKKNFNTLMAVFHRLWRIVPVYYFVVMCFFLIPLMASGPMFHDIIGEAMGPCYQYWWRNLLFINNLFSIKDVCFMHTWYISVDMQLYLISLLALYILAKCRRTGLCVLFIGIFASMVYTGVMLHEKGGSATVYKNDPDPEDRLIFYLHNYANTVSRLGPYFIGVLVGYALATKPKVELSKAYLFFGWCTAAISSGMVIYVTAIWYHVQAPSALDTVMYGAFYKVAFTAGIGWMIFCCVSGHGGIVNTILSWNAWVPLGRLTFLIYLIQPAFQVVYIASYRYAQEASHLQTMIHSFGFLCISGLIAVVITMLVESPFMAMEKIILGNQEKGNEKKNGELELNHKNGDIKLSFEGRPAISTIFK